GPVGGEDLQTAVAQCAHDTDRIGLDGDRQVEQRPGRGADDLGVECVDALAGDHDGVRPGGVGAPDDRAQVARVADLGAHHDQSGVRVDDVQGGEDGAASRHHPLRRDRVGDRLDDVVGDDVPRRSVIDHLAMALGGVDRGEHLDDRLRDRERLTDRLGTLGEELAGLGTECASGEPPSDLDPSGADGQVAGARHWCGAAGQATVSALGALTSSGRLALATSTRALNAAGSLTARSARILRSTSTSAAFRPWMNRLYVMPWARAAALIRWIHRRRKSPFLALRSLYE